MSKSLRFTIALAGVAGAIAIPSIVFGNARRTEGTLAAQQLAETPFISTMNGSNETPAAGDPDGSGAATVSFAKLESGAYEVCWDMSYTGISAPVMAHIHAGAAGVAGPVVIDFGLPTPDAFSGCTDATAAVVDPILANPAAFYTNVHTGDFSAGAIRGQLAKGPEPAGSTHFLATPLRAYDSRDAGKTKLAAADTRPVSLASGVTGDGASQLAVPPGATAAIITLTATETGGPGYLTVFSNAITQVPATSNLNWVTAGDTVAVTTQVAVDSSGRIKVSAGPASTHFIVDVVGYLY
jgi:hypothetical protein